MRLTATHLRRKVSRVLDQVLDTGLPVEIERRGRILWIAADRPSSKLDRLVERDSIVGDPEGIVHVDWSTGWGA